MEHGAKFFKKFKRWNFIYKKPKPFTDPKCQITLLEIFLTVFLSNMTFVVTCLQEFALPENEVQLSFSHQNKFL